MTDDDALFELILQTPDDMWENKGSDSMSMTVYEINVGKIYIFFKNLN